MPYEICTHPWRFAVEPFRIADGLFYVGNKDVSCHLVDSGKGLILIDTAFPQTTYLLLESIRRLRFDPDDIAHILHCHGHYDHFGGTRQIVELTGAKTFLGKADIEIVKRKPELSWGPEYGVEFCETFEVDVPLNDGDEISLGDVSIECMSVPGHTPGSMAFFFEVTHEGKEYKVGLHGGPGLNTLTDAYLEEYGLPRSRREDYLKSVERLRKRKVDITLGAHPSHNDTLGKRERMTQQSNPFIDPGAWSRFLEGFAAQARKQFGLI